MKKNIVLSLACSFSLMTAAAQPLKFMTFNIWGEYFGNPAVEREADARAVVLRYRPDVIAFQEADRCWWNKARFFKDLEGKDRYGIVKGDMAAALKKGGWAGRKTLRCDVNPQPLAFNRDRLELIDSGVVIFHARISDKGATWAVLKDRQTGFRFIAFSTHFWYMWNGKESDALKETNATHLMNALQSLKSRYPYPVIGGGDLNSVPGSWAHDLLEGRGLARAADCAQTRDPTVTHHGNPVRGADGRWHGKPPSGKGAAIDHVFAETNGIRMVEHKVVVDREALDSSDHSPVIVTFEPAGKERTAPSPGSATARLKVDFSKKLGRVKPLHQAGQPPMVGWDYPLMKYLPEAGIRYSRLHDTGGVYGESRFVDITNIFRDFSADETDPKSYDFAFTDRLIAAMMKHSVKPFYRLGETIENFAFVKRYRTFVPADKAKWARICEHIIRHYNEGWANGFRYGIEYWEIWNEPDFTTLDWNPMWTGTAGDFYELYETTAVHLKKCFPHLKIGGYGSCGFWAITSDERARREGKDTRTAERKAQEEYHVSFFRGFLKRVKAKKIPFDFFTFHSYSPVDDMIRQVQWCCQTMKAEGFGDVELNLDEWLPAPSHKKLGTALQAAEVAALIAGVADTRLDMAMIYDARCGVGNYSPLFNPLTYKPHPAYEVLKMYESLYAAGTRVAVEDDRAKGLYATAAVSSDGRRGWLFASNTSDKDVDLPRPADAAWRCVSCRSVSGREGGCVIVPPEGVIHPREILLVEYSR